jgi:hypothetical protein
MESYEAAGDDLQLDRLEEEFAKALREPKTPLDDPSSKRSASPSGLLRRRDYAGGTTPTTDRRRTARRVRCRSR